MIDCARAFGDIRRSNSNSNNDKHCDIDDINGDNSEDKNDDFKNAANGGRQRRKRRGQ